MRQGGLSLDLEIEGSLPIKSQKGDPSEKPSALERIRYLSPNRYFRMYHFDSKARGRVESFWLPEGYLI